MMKNELTIAKADENGRRAVSIDGSVIGYVWKTTQSTPVLNGRIAYAYTRRTGYMVAAIGDRRALLGTAQTRQADAVDYLVRFVVGRVANAIVPSIR